MLASCAIPGYFQPVVIGGTEYVDGGVHSVTNALVIPVDALLAQSGGGYAVEVVDAHGNHRLVSVRLGLFDDADGLVQVTGTGLVVGQRVVVPNL